MLDSQILLHARFTNIYVINHDPSNGNAIMRKCSVFLACSGVDQHITNTSHKSA